MTDNGVFTDNLKKRSYRACISDAFRSTCRLIRRLTAGNKVFFALFAIAQGIAGVLTEYVKPGLLYVGFEPHIGALVLLLTVVAVSSLLIDCKMWSTVNGRGIGWNITRLLKTLPVSLCFIAAYLAAAATAAYFYISASKAPQDIPLINLAGIAATLLPILMIFTLPLAYVYTRYLVEPGVSMRKTFGRAYGDGFSHWWTIFLTLLLATICIFIVEAALCLPYHILSAANDRAAITASVYGDASAMPSDYYALVFTASLFGGIVSIGIAMFKTYTLYNIYQTIRISAGERRTRKADGKR